MKLYEFEGKQLLKASGVPVPDGRVVSSPTELGDVTGPVVVKAQALSGKRGKAGLVSFCRERDEAEGALRKVLGAEHHNEKIEKALVEQGLNIKEEHYACITYDTLTRSPALIFSAQGGMDIEEYKAVHPDRVVVQAIDMNLGLQPWVARQAVQKAGISGIKMLKLAEFISRMWNCFAQNDCRVLEVNPLV